MELWKSRMQLKRSRLRVELLFAGIVLQILSLSGCGLCANSIIVEKTSPNKQWKAISFVRNCGATTWFVTYVSVIRSDKALPGGKGNVLCIDDNDGKTHGLIVSPKGEIPLTLEWKSDRLLFVGYPARANILSSEQEVHGIRIMYQPISPVSGKE
jgi:hypothetical protein